MRLSAIVVAFGKQPLLDECLARLAAALERIDDGAELIVVANDGRPASRSGLVMVAGSPELGFAGGVAAGLSAARGEWIALVNDDCMVEPEALHELLAAVERRPEVGSVAAQVRFATSPGTLNSAGIEVDELGVARERLLGAPVGACGPERVEVFGPSATLALYRRAMLDGIGGVDPSFFAYLEDADLAWRARMAGWRCVLAPRAVALHHHSATLGHGSAAKHLLVGRNRVRMLAKNATSRQLRRQALRIVTFDAAYVAYACTTDRTLAPLAGRLRGLREWRAYREAGNATRREITLPAPPGLAAALRRNRTYRAEARVA